MGTFRDVSRAEPCPICGKSDWCSILTPDNPAFPGHELNVCRRINSPNVVGSNGKDYTLLKDLADCSSLYCEDAALKGQDATRNGGYRFKGSSSAPPPKPKVDYGVPPLGHNALDNAYRSLLNTLPLSRNHREKLMRDGWTEQLIKQSMIRSLHLRKVRDPKRPYGHDDAERRKICRQLMDKSIPLLGVPGFYQDADDEWTFTGKPGMLIPIPDRYGNIYRLRLRIDFPGTDENGKERNKYNNFSSYYASSDGINNAYKNGCRSGSNIGVYNNDKIISFELCYITEGEKKAILANHTLNVPIISLPGVNSYQKLLAKDEFQNDIIDYFIGKGCSAFAIAYDADKYVNEKVMQCESNLIVLLKRKGVSVFTAYWNPAFGKGLDDILALGIRPILIPA